MISPRELDRLKRKLRKIYEHGTGPVSVSVNSLAEVFLWSAKADDPAELSFNVGIDRYAIYVAYEWKGWQPSDHELSIEVEIGTKSVTFLGVEGQPARTWKKVFKGIYVRAVEFGDLPCEDHSSRCLGIYQKTRDFSVVGRAVAASKGEHFEPLRLTLEAT